MPASQGQASGAAKAGAGNMRPKASSLEAEDGGTTASILFKDIPSGIRPEDNEAGTRSTLEKLARSVE